LLSLITGRRLSIVGLLSQPLPGALTQAFYLSPWFRRLEIETMDYRLHPVLGGISSTRWAAYEQFAHEQPRLVSELEPRPRFNTAVQLHPPATAQRSGGRPSDLNIRHTQARNGSLNGAGMLSGSSADNRLSGSGAGDVLLGWEGNDTLIGARGDDLLSGGSGGDRFVVTARATTRAAEIDTITDFDGSAGDRLQIEGARTYRPGSSAFLGRPGEVISAVWMAKVKPGAHGPPHPSLTQGLHLSIDRNGDKQVDLIVNLPGLTELRPEWLLLG
jgi:hypothetical protein